jgi:hypothetical protein
VTGHSPPLRLKWSGAREDSMKARQLVLSARRRPASCLQTALSFRNRARPVPMISLTTKIAGYKMEP